MARNALMFFVVIATVLVLQLTREAASAPNGACQCAGQFLTDTKRCDRFYLCRAANDPNSFGCPANLHFNTDLKVCDYPANVKCKQGKKRRNPVASECKRS